MITVNGKQLVWKSGMTISDLLTLAGFNYPMIAVSVNEEFVAQEEYSSFLVEDNADVRAVHICHGG